MNPAPPVTRVRPRVDTDDEARRVVGGAAYGQGSSVKPDVLDVSDTVSHVKAKVASMVAERQANEGPSAAWSQVSGYFDYVRDMDAKHFTRLRLHTYHLTWDSYQPYLLADDAAVAAFQARWQRLVRDTPDDLIVYEPEDGFGFSCGTGLVSIDVLRYQQTINTLHQQGVIDALRRRARRATVLEIGPGYGGLTHHLASILGHGDHGVAFVLIDLPEVLLFSGAYLALHNPGKTVYIYDNEDFEDVLGSGRISSFDFVLLPNYRLQDLRALRFDLALNLASMQEMRSSQVEEYLQVVCETCELFYSWNQDKQPQNAELGEGELSELLKRYFDATEVLPPAKQRTRTAVLNAVRRLGTMARLPGAWSGDPLLPYRQYLCRPTRARP